MNELLAGRLMSDFEAQHRLTQGIYINQSENDVGGRMEVALKAVLQAAPIEAKLHQARREKQLPKSGSLEQILNAALAKNIINE